MENAHEYPHRVDLSPPVSFVVDVNLHDRDSEYSERESSCQYRFKIERTSQERATANRGRLWCHPALYHVEDHTSQTVATPISSSNTRTQSQ